MTVSTRLPWHLAQTQWASTINPIVNNPLNNVSILKDVNISIGANTINHLLGQTQQGWFLIDINAPVTLYRSQPFNAQTLTLTSSGSAIVTLGVF